MKLKKEKSRKIDDQFCKEWKLSEQQPNINIDGIDVEQVDHVKLLRFTISHDLSWKKTCREHCDKRMGSECTCCISRHVQELSSPA